MYIKIGFKVRFKRTQGIRSLYTMASDLESLLECDSLKTGVMVYSIAVNHAVKGSTSVYIILVKG